MIFLGPVTNIVGIRPNGPAELSPGLRPQADALGQQAPQSRGLKGREILNRELSRLRQKLSRPVRPRGWIAFPPRVLACGLNPGLHSAGPLGRTHSDRIASSGVTDAARCAGTQLAKRAMVARIRGTAAKVIGSVGLTL